MVNSCRRRRAAKCAESPLPAAQCSSFLPPVGRSTADSGTVSRAPFTGCQSLSWFAVGFRCGAVIFCFQLLSSACVASALPCVRAFLSQVLLTRFSFYRQSYYRRFLLQAVCVALAMPSSKRLLPRRPVKAKQASNGQRYLHSTWKVYFGCASVLSHWVWGWKSFWVNIVGWRLWVEGYYPWASAGGGLPPLDFWNQRLLSFAVQLVPWTGHRWSGGSFWW